MKEQGVVPAETKPITVLKTNGSVKLVPWRSVPARCGKQFRQHAGSPSGQMLRYRRKSKQ